MNAIINVHPIASLPVYFYGDNNSAILNALIDAENYVLDVQLRPTWCDDHRSWARSKIVNAAAQLESAELLGVNRDDQRYVNVKQAFTVQAKRWLF